MQPVGTNRNEKASLLHRYANQLLLGLIVVMLGVFLAAVHHSDRMDISNVADETLLFIKSVCQRYDNYAVGRRASDLKDIYDKAGGLAKLADVENQADLNYLRRFVETHNLTGAIVTDENLYPVTQTDVNGADAYALWQDFLHTDNKRDILKYKNKTYTGTVTLGGVEYRVAIISRRSVKGLVLCYAKTGIASTDVYETELEKTLDNNTFHKNPRIVITNGEKVIASNLQELPSGTPLKECPVQNTSDTVWANNELVHLHWSNSSWYGKRIAYQQYYIYVFYPSSEVFDNVLPVVTSAIAIYALVCMILLLVRHASEKKYRLRDKKQLNTIRAIGSLFVTTSILYIDKGTIEGIVSTPRAQAVLDETNDACRVAEMLARRIIAPEYAESYIEFLDCTTMADRLQGKTSISNVCRDQNGVWFSTYLIPMEYDADGQLKEVLFASRNIDHFMKKEKSYQEELRRTARDAEKANAAKSSFLRRMSHDLRTPVNGIRGMACMARQALDTPEKAGDYIGKIIASADYLQSILEDILRMSKLESGKLEFEEKPYDLKRVIADTAGFITARADESDIHCEIDASQLIHTRIMGSPLHLRQVLQNVLANAVKFTPAGGSIHAVCRELSCADGVMQFEFVCTDTGIGMDPEFQKHIFEPFTQEEDSARSVLMGTGLGLPIAKEILDQRGGTIKVESSKGRGSTFTVTLPLKLDTTQPAAQLPEAQHIALEGIRVMIVEDNEINMEIVRCMLESKGAVITEAHNGREAVEQFAAAPAHSFDVVLMDIMMPEMDGLEATRTIRAMPRADAAEVPIFAMTANSFVDDIHMSKDAGMNEHLSKPLNIDDVAAMIYRYCHT